MRRLLWTFYLWINPRALKRCFTHDYEESTGEVAWEPMEEFGETEADRLYIKRKA